MRGWRGRLVTHPVTVLALVLWWANDHVFKRAWPGWVTGKLSDVCGVWVVAAVVAAALGSVRIGAGAVAVAFAAVKTVPGAALLVAPLLGGVTRRDPTDLLALLVLLPMLAPLPRVAAPFSGSGRPPRRWAVVVVVLATVGVTSATSDYDDVAATALEPAAAGSVHVGIDNEGTREWWLLNEDGTWTATERPSTTGPPVRCTAEGCWSVGKDDVVYLDEIAAYPRDESERQPLHPTGGPTGLEDLVVVETQDGDEVWVAASSAGVLHRSPEGVWSLLPLPSATRPTAVPEVSSSSDAGSFHMPPLLVGLLALAVAALVGGSIALAVRRSRRSAPESGPASPVFPLSTGPPGVPPLPPLLPASSTQPPRVRSFEDLPQALEPPP